MCILFFFLFILLHFWPLSVLSVYLNSRDLRDSTQYSNTNSTGRQHDNGSNAGQLQSALIVAHYHQRLLQFNNICHKSVLLAIIQQISRWCRLWGELATYPAVDA
jgi:hypothetical protein